MRLPEDKIKAGILHPEKDVRSQAVLHFSRSYTRDDSILPLAIQAVEQYGWDNAFTSAYCMKGLSPNDTTLPWVMAQLQHDDAKKPNYFGWPARWHTLNSLLSNADANLLSRHKQAILDLKSIEAEARSIVAQRIAILSRDADTCWRELEEFCFLAKDVENVGDVDLEYAYALIEGIARGKQDYADKVLSILAKKIEDSESNVKVWMETFAVRMAGEMRLQAAIPLIIAKLNDGGEEAEWLSDECESALGIIGGDAAIHAVADLYREGDRHLRMIACSVMQHVHSDLAVTTALNFLPEEENGTMRALLAEGLASHFAFEAIEPIRQLVIDGSYDETQSDLKRNVVIAATLMGVEFPELEPWKSEVENARLAIETRLIEAHSERLQQEIHRLQLKEKRLLREKQRLEEQQYEDEQPPPKTKIGRNDPCPCGSGKKFKKCCINKQSGNDRIARINSVDQR